MGEAALAAARALGQDGHADAGAITRAKLAQLQRDLFAARTALNHAAAGLRQASTGAPVDEVIASCARSVTALDAVVDRIHRQPRRRRARPASRSPDRRSALIPRVHRRSGSMAEVLRRLFGRGEYGGHHDPRVVAAWAYATTGGVEELQPSVTAGGGRSLRWLIGLLEQPVAAGVNPPDKHVWHCSLHNHADDPLLSGQQWAQVAGEFMAEVGLAPNDDLDAGAVVGYPPRPGSRARGGHPGPPGRAHGLCLERLPARAGASA